MHNALHKTGVNKTKNYLQNKETIACLCYENLKRVTMGIKMKIVFPITNYLVGKGRTHLTENNEIVKNDLITADFGIHFLIMLYKISRSQYMKQTIIML